MTTEEWTQDIVQYVMSIPYLPLIYSIISICTNLMGIIYTFLWARRKIKAGYEKRCAKRQVAEKSAKRELASQVALLLSEKYPNSPINTAIYMDPNFSLSGLVMCCPKCGTVGDSSHFQGACPAGGDHATIYTHPNFSSASNPSTTLVRCTKCGGIGQAGNFSKTCTVGGLHTFVRFVESPETYKKPAVSQPMRCTRCGEVAQSENFSKRCTVAGVHSPVPFTECSPPKDPKESKEAILTLLKCQTCGRKASLVMWAAEKAKGWGHVNGEGIACTSTETVPDDTLVLSSDKLEKCERCGRTAKRSVWADETYKGLSHSIPDSKVLCLCKTRVHV